MARRRRSSRRRAPRRRSSVRASRRGFMSGGMVSTVAGTLIGAAAAIGGGALLQTGANLAKVELPAIVKQYAPIAGAGVVAGLAALSKRWKDLTVPALVGGAAMVALGMFLKPKGAGAYNRLRGTGAGNVAGVLNGARGAGNVGRVINMAAVA